MDKKNKNIESNLLQILKLNLRSKLITHFFERIVKNMLDWLEKRTEKKSKNFSLIYYQKFIKDYC